MKNHKIAALLAFVFVITVPLFGQNQTDNSMEPYRLKGMGLVGDLCFIKNAAESIIRPIVLRDSANNQYKREDAIVMKHYLLVKTQVDQILEQLAADLTLKGKIGLYRKLDKAFKDDDDLTDRTTKSKNKMLARYIKAVNELFKSESFKVLILSPKNILFPKLATKDQKHKEKLESLRKDLAILQLTYELVDKKGPKIYDSLSTQSEILKSSEWLKGDSKTINKQMLQLKIRDAEQTIATAEASVGIEDFSVFDIIYGGIEQALAIEAAVRETQQTKIDGILVILDKLHLADPSTFKPKKE